MPYGILYQSFVVALAYFLVGAPLAVCFMHLTFRCHGSSMFLVLSIGGLKNSPKNVLGTLVVVPHSCYFLVPYRYLVR